MISSFLQIVSIFTFGCLLACSSVGSAGVSEAAAGEAKPSLIAAEEVLGGKQVAVFAGGCFWGVEAVFENIKGVSDVISGYSGGTAKTADYELVSGGKTAHAEAVKITFDPAVVSYEQLLDVFFRVAHDPTELNRQGPDTGPQYRSAVFYTDDVQKQSTLAYIEKLNLAGVYGKPAVTQVVALEKFYDAEAYHQNYLPQNLNSPYIIAHDLPKLENLKKQFPALYAKK